MNNKWNMINGKTVKLTYEDDVLFVKKDDFNRAFGCIVSATKDIVKRDFAVHDND